MNHVEKLNNFLDKAAEAYYKGTPFISDEEFDSLCSFTGYKKVGYVPNVKQRHKYKMYSLDKKYQGEDDTNFSTLYVRTPKLDGAALSLLYYDGMLVQATTRGDGEYGEAILEHVRYVDGIPDKEFIADGYLQITGEMVLPKSVENARNVVSGALHLKDPKDVRGKGLRFIAYGVETSRYSTYTEDMQWLKKIGFDTVCDEEWGINYKTDGEVVRINSNRAYEDLGHTSKHPRGACAIKDPKDVATLPTALLDVTWQVGPSGKVTPVAHFEPITIEGAIITKASLHNAGYVEELELEIGDTLLVTRRGGIIPYITGKL